MNYNFNSSSFFKRLAYYIKYYFVSIYKLKTFEENEIFTFTF